ncbi:hypothetical protein KOR42_14680 [Thalassoglobus neptunius]|uniref:Uncharacterized protein n=2 Tax=Thalassoglobus neptunius TaxID=1938619 RepID=A0A5C5X4Q9_9PLAN|nr:hypothetical protein KOR42_14680 [Thalassoglobus neptunius]
MPMGSPYPEGYPEKFQPVSLLLKVQYQVIPWLRQNAVESCMRKKKKQARLMWLDDADDWLNTVIMHIETQPLFAVRILDQNFVQTGSLAGSEQSISYRHRGQPWLDVIRYILKELLADLSTIQPAPKQHRKWKSLVETLLAGFPARPVKWVQGDDLIWIKEEGRYEVRKKKEDT